MREDVLVSVIIPLYNNGHLLGRCLDSILCQPVKDIEVIIIDDGSTDNGLEVARDYENRFSNISVFHQKNAGVSVARNEGMRHAKGLYLAFCDPDDMWLNSAFDNSIREVLENEKQYDVICCGMFRGDTEGSITREYRVSKEDESLIGEKVRWIDFHRHTVVSQFYRKDFVNEHGIQFPVGIVIGEDSCFVEQALFCARSCVAIDQPIYIYRYNSNSVMNDKERTAFDSIINLYRVRIWEAENFPKMRKYDDKITTEISKYYHALAAGSVLEMLQGHFKSSLNIRKCEEQIARYELTDVVKNYRDYGLGKKIEREFALYHNHPRLFAVKYRCYGFARNIAKAFLPESIQKHIRK